MTDLLNNEAYRNFFMDLKKQIQQARVKAMISVNSELVKLYWTIGKGILKRQKEQKWGSKMIDQLSLDLKNSFPDIKGFSRRNLFYMRKFASEYPDFEIVQQVVAQISWSHNTVLLDKCNAMNERLWYAKNAMENGWSRGIMSVQIESGLYERKGKALTNFKETLSDMDSDLAEETLKDPYVFDFLNLAEKVKEKDLEKALVDNIAQFLLELGKGFAFVGRQYHLNVGGDDFYIDLLFFHIELQSYVVIELKTKYFKPEHAGQLGFYLVAVDAQLKKDYHNPTIGLTICKHKNEIVVEYSLKHITNPVGVSEYKLSNSFKEKIKNSLPSVEELENGLSRLDD